MRVQIVGPRNSSFHSKESHPTVFVRDRLRPSYLSEILGVLMLI